MAPDKTSWCPTLSAINAPEGQMGMRLPAGKYRPYDGNVDEKTALRKQTISYGVLIMPTYTGGVQAAANYRARFWPGKTSAILAAGSADVTAAWSKKKMKRTSGQSRRIRYGKNIPETGTNITVAGYRRYSTSNNTANGCDEYL